MVVRVNTSSAGFSLIEMLVVVAILSILAIGTSLLVVRTNGALDRATNTLLADAGQVRHLAMISGLDHALIFTDSGWHIARKSGAGWATISSKVPRGLRVSVTGPDKVLIFDADGWVTPLNIRLEAADAARDCRAGTGQLLVCA
jgi:type II secretion system protein H